MPGTISPIRPPTGMKDKIIHDHHYDGIDRRGFLKCMAWVGTGIVYSLTGGILRSQTIAAAGNKPAPAKSDLTFVQISDSHIGFSKEANQDVIGTLQTALARINALPARPEFVLHTGDLSHLSKPAEFDTLDQVLRDGKIGPVFFVPGEHDVINDDGKLY